jgi:hypothetical protein
MVVKAPQISVRARLAVSLLAEMLKLLELFLPAKPLHDNRRIAWL